MKLVLTLTLVTSMAIPSMKAFDFQVSSIEKVPLKGVTEAYHPVFSPDGKSVLVTSEGYDGLGIVSLADGQFRQLSDRAGAGYKFAQTADGSQILLRENDFMTQKLSLYVLDVASAKEECIAPVVEHTNTLIFNGATAAYAEPVQKKIRTHALRTAGELTTKQVEPQTILTEEDLKLVLYTGQTRTEVDPILASTGKDVNYCWSSLSPDGTRMLFVAGNDAYTSLLDGSELVCLGPLHAPVWKDNNTVVAMRDSDDGHFFTMSDIVAADIRTAETMQLTPRTDDIKMFPSVSADGNRIAYHTTKGELYIINLQTK